MQYLKISYWNIRTVYFDYKMKLILFLHKSKYIFYSNTVTVPILGLRWTLWWKKYHIVHKTFDAEHL